ncbi:MAG TPA: NUDIX hydrolase [Chloroflexota bacterium]|nr:NUDIX hydrolase [Chloroflexota bacterium]
MSANSHDRASRPAASRGAVVLLLGGPAGGGKRQRPRISVVEESVASSAFAPPDYPKKQMGTGALFFDGAGQLLLVKPTYREGWSIPGGVVEGAESPRQACAREVREEIGLDVELGRLLAVDYTSLTTSPRESLQYIFDGGVLDEDAIGRITLPPAELSAFRFAPVDEAIALLTPRLARRVPHALAALAAGSATYLEDGAPPGSASAVATTGQRPVAGHVGRNEHLSPVESQTEAQEARTLEVFRENLAHVSPVAGAEAVVVRDGRILLHRRADSGLWAMCGGLAEIGETLAEAAARELWEEARVRGRITRLLGLFDSLRWGMHTKVHLYAAVFEAESEDEPSPTSEATEFGFFGPDDLPPLSPSHVQRVPIVLGIVRGERPAPYVDLPEMIGAL